MEKDVERELEKQKTMEISSNPSTSHLNVTKVNENENKEDDISKTYQKTNNQSISSHNNLSQQQQQTSPSTLTITNKQQTHINHDNNINSIPSRSLSISPSSIPMPIIRNRCQFVPQIWKQEICSKCYRHVKDHSNSYSFQNNSNDNNHHENEGVEKSESKNKTQDPKFVDKVVQLISVADIGSNFTVFNSRELGIPSRFAMTKLLNPFELEESLSPKRVEEIVSEYNKMRKKVDNQYVSKVYCAFARNETVMV